MMITSLASHRELHVGGRPQALPAGGLRLGTEGGRLDVIEGRVWLTRVGDLDDHVLAQGESIDLAAPAGVLVEAWEAGGSAVVAWRPARRAWPTTLAARFAGLFSRPRIAPAGALRRC